MKTIVFFMGNHLSMTTPVISIPPIGATMETNPTRPTWTAEAPWFRREKNNFLKLVLQFGKTLTSVRKWTGRVVR